MSRIALGWLLPISPSAAHAAKGPLATVGTLLLYF
jgi:hypothetical protein